MNHFTVCVFGLSCVCVCVCVFSGSNNAYGDTAVNGAVTYEREHNI